MRQPHALLNRVKSLTSDVEQKQLVRISQELRVASTLLPIQTVGVSGDARTYSYCVALSSDQPPNWSDLFFLARLIPRICHNINRYILSTCIPLQALL